MMARYIFQFTSAPLPGMDDAFNQWYDDVHMPDVLRQPGFLSGQRYAIIDAVAAHPRYVAAYEVECENPQVTLGKLFEDGRNMVISPAMDTASVSVAILKPRLPIKKRT